MRKTISAVQRIYRDGLETRKIRLPRGAADGTLPRMKALIECAVPAMLAPGGTQVQVEQTRAGLEASGVEVEFLRWWDRGQRGDLIHYFGTPSNSFLDIARNAGMPVVMTNLFSETCNRSDARLARQGWLIQTALKIPLARQVKKQLNWGTYVRAPHNIVALECEKQVLQTVYHVPSERISLVPLGLADDFLRAGPRRTPGDYLVYTGTIYHIKHSLELARLAIDAKVPILFVGKPYHPGDPYWHRFQTMIDGQWVRYHPHVETQAEIISLLQSARGFVLMSNYENWSISTHEAVACGLPVLLQDQKWSRERFGNEARYFKTIGYSADNVARLKNFYAEAPALPAPAIKLHSWLEVAQELKKVYAQVLARPSAAGDR